VLEIHLDVLDSMAQKMCTLTAGPPPPSQMIGEFVYPAKRAKELEDEESTHSDRTSYKGFTQVVQNYEALVQLFDRSRVSTEVWSEAAAEVCDQSRLISAQIHSVRLSLVEEG
jgi:hypothetical protein